jgi:DNA-binding LytR/AlgR family response regulator/class 3 adenylate cyclase
MNGLRKLVAILAIDVVGYSRLVGNDEDGTIQRLRVLRQGLIDAETVRHRGRMVKTTGDGFLIEFASVVDAVRCAIDIQRGAESRNAAVTPDLRIELRAGINVGDVVMEGDDLLGDGVNVAARLEGIAQPNEICVSESAYEQVRDKLDLVCVDMGPQTLKNIARPVRVYRLQLDGRASMASAAEGGAPRQPAAPRQPNAVIAEDEPLLADELAEHLAALWPALRVVATVSDGVAALHAVEAHAPDIAFLDIHMPRLTGLEVARQIAGRCHVVFITAFDQHALGAFEAGATDYVMKPLVMARLVTTVQRLKARLSEAPSDLSQMPGLQEPRPPAPTSYLQWIRASRGSAVRLLTVDEICYFKADSKYTMVVTADSESLIKKTIKELVAGLDPNMFWQIHRSVIVNVRAIDSVVRSGGGELAIRLKQRRETLVVSEQHHHLFRQM